MQFHLFDPSPCGFPKPRVNLLPTLGRGSLGWPNFADDLALKDGKKCSFFARGRYALRAAYSMAGVGPSGALLAPSYHCRTMLDPAIRLGAEIRLYPLGDRLAPDIIKIREILDDSKIAIKAILATHFFGMPQDLCELAKLCRERGISLIEDCAHAIVTGRQSDPFGRYGRYVISSPYKFFPCTDGGVLVDNDGGVKHKGQPPNLLDELKEIFISLQQLLVGSGDFDAKSESLDSEIDTLLATGFTVANQSQKVMATPSRNYAQEIENSSGFIWSRWLAKHTNMSRLVARRRANFSHWLRTVDGLPNCKPIFSDLPDDVIPYMFPLYIEDPDTHFYFLKHLGVPVWRWDELAMSDCKSANDYRLRLLHLPCHQELSHQEMAWMTTAVSKVMKISTRSR